MIKWGSWNGEVSLDCPGGPVSSQRSLQEGSRRVRDRDKTERDWKILHGWLWRWRRGHEPRHAGGLWKPEKEGNGFVSRASGKNTAPPTHFRPLTSRSSPEIGGNKLARFHTTKFVVTCYRKNRKPTQLISILFLNNKVSTLCIGCPKVLMQF